MFSFLEIACTEYFVPLFTIIRQSHTFEIMEQEQIIILYLYKYGTIF
jgi:hypothetical protein